MPDLVKTHRPRARKAQWCNACQARTIQPGDVYQRDVYAYDGRVYDWPVCLPCGVIADTVYEWSFRWEEGVTGEDFQAWAEENRDDPEHGPAARAYLKRTGNEPARALLNNPKEN